MSLRERLGLLPDEACLCFGKPFFGEPLLELMVLWLGDRIADDIISNKSSLNERARLANLLPLPMLLFHFLYFSSGTTPYSKQ